MDFNTVVLEDRVGTNERLLVTVKDGSAEIEDCPEFVAIPLAVCDGANGVAVEHLLKKLEGDSFEEKLSHLLARLLREPEGD